MEYSILEVGARLLRAGEIMSQWEFDSLVAHEIMMPDHEMIGFYRDCFTEVTDEEKARVYAEDTWKWSRILAGPYVFTESIPDSVEPPEDHPRVIELTVDIVLLNFVPYGISRDADVSGGLDYEIDSMGLRDVLDPDGHRHGEEIPGGDFRTIANMVLEKIGPKTERATSEGCHILVMYWYDGGKDPDTWLGPGEYWSEWGLVGQVMSGDLEAIAEAIKARQK